MPDPKVLIVDDEKVFCKNLKSYLELHNYHCAIANTGQEALDIVDNETFSIIILDVLMPSMDGYTLLRELKKKNVKSPCIVITAREKLQDLFDMERVARFMPKPFDFDRIKNVIDEVIDEQKESNVDEQLNDSSNPFSGTKILLIEDEVKLASNFKTYLEMKEFEVVHAINGSEGLKLVESYNPDLIISDIMMPEMDGYSMLKQLKKIRDDIPVIILTGKDRLKDLFEVEGISAFITKPFNLVEVENKIKEILTSRN